jgi:hypothetical protein
MGKKHDVKSHGFGDIYGDVGTHHPNLIVCVEFFDQEAFQHVFENEQKLAQLQIWHAIGKSM